MYSRIAISIINYRTGDLTLACVRSVLADAKGIDARIVVVDNASGDGSADQIDRWIRAQSPPVPVDLVRSDKNSGFSGGHNQGIQACAAEYYLILNSDAVLRPGFLAEILAQADQAPKAGFVAPQIETDDGQIQVSCFRFHSPRSELVRAACSAPVTRLFNRHVVALPPPVDPDQIEWASFACILLRQKMIADVGPMDEGYFLYFEDAEYCLRARRKGWRIARAPGAVAVHFRGGSGPVKSLEKARKRLPDYFYRSRTRFLYQAHGYSGLIGANLLWHLGRAIAQMRRLVGKPVPAAIQTESRDIWINVKTPLKPHTPAGE